MTENARKSISNNFIENFKKMTERIINKEAAPKEYKFEKIPDDRTMTENLLYFMIGLDTTHIKMDHTNEIKMILNPEYKNKNIILSFESICVNYRKIKSFINMIQYSNDTIKRLISKYLIERIEKYHKKVLSMFSKNIEDIYILIYPFIEEFKEYNHLICEIEMMNELEIVSYIESRKERIFEKYYDILLESITAKVTRDIYKWIFYGEIANGFFIQERNIDELQYDECFYKMKFKMSENIPGFIKQETKKIYEIGLYINIFKVLNIAYDRKYEEVDSEDFYKLINQIHSDILQVYRSAIFPILFLKTQKIYQTYFVVNSNNLNDVFDSLKNKLFLPIEQHLHSINAINKDESIKYKSSEMRINHFILKILNIEKIVSNSKKNVLENLSLDFVDDSGILQIFYAKKIFFELELIFRFLYAFFSIGYIFKYLEKNDFTRNAILFIENVKSSMFLSFINDFELDKENIVESFEKFIKKSLKMAYLNNVKIFQCFSDMFDLFYEYIYTKENEKNCLQKFRELIYRLSAEMENNCTDYYFLCFLSSIK